MILFILAIVIMIAIVMMKVIVIMNVMCYNTDMEYIIICLFRMDIVIMD